MAKEKEWELSPEEMVEAMFEWSKTLPAELPEITQAMRFEVIARAAQRKLLEYLKPYLSSPPAIMPGEIWRALFIDREKLAGQ